MMKINKWICYLDTDEKITQHNYIFSKHFDAENLNFRFFFEEDINDIFDTFNSKQTETVRRAISH